MPSAYTDSNRFTLQATGEGTNVWGLILNEGAFKLIDDAMDGAFVVSGNTILTTANGADDQARRRILRVTATATITIPPVEKWYIVRAEAAATLTNGSSSATVSAGDTAIVLTDGVDIWLARQTDMGGQRIRNVGAPTTASDGATRQYVDDTAFATQAGDFPALADNAGRPLVVTLDETSVGWQGPFQTVDDDFSVAPGGRYVVDTSGGPVIATLPTGPEGAIFSIATGPGGWNNNPLTLDRNGQTIMGLAEDMTCRIDNARVTLELRAGDWWIVQ